MTRHDSPLDVLKEWAEVGPDVHIRMHMFRNAFATWGCQAGVVNG